MAGLMQAAGKPERTDALANRERILEAARQAFARRGLDAEIREIAERAGVGIGTLYRHFESREGLLAALIQQTEEDLLRRIRAAVETEEPRAALRAMIGAAVEACEQFGALTEAVLAGRLDRFSSRHTEFTALLANLLQRGIAEGIFRSDLDVPVTCAALESVFTSGKLLELAVQRSYPRAADAVADFFLYAVAARPKPDELT